MKPKYRLEDAVASAKQRKGVCLSTSYKNVQTPMLWRCSEGHEWSAPYTGILRGTWCEKCAREAKAQNDRAYTIDDLRTFAATRNGTCLSTAYRSIRKPVVWQCAEAHQWSAAFQDVRRGTWCPSCAMVEQGVAARGHTIEEMRELAVARGGAGAECLSTEYINNKLPLRWKCAKGHVWDTPLGSVLRGSWCPTCAFAAMSEQKKVYSLSDMRDWAAARGGSCVSSKYKSVRTKLEWKCGRGHTWRATPSSIRIGSWCPTCAHADRVAALRLKLAYTIADMQEVAAGKGGSCLSMTYGGVFAKLEWRCAEGHQWKATPASVVEGTWCRLCGIERARKKQQGYDIPFFRRLAAERGGECLSEVYVNVFANLRWKCAVGHIWDAAPQNIKAGGWCPKCSYARAGLARRKYTLKSMQALAAERGGVCLSETFALITDRLLWRCGRGHEFQAVGANVLAGNWCRRCSRMRVRTANVRRQLGTMQAAANARTDAAVDDTC